MLFLISPRGARKVKGGKLAPTQIIEPGIGAALLTCIGTLWYHLQKSQKALVTAALTHSKVLLEQQERYTELQKEQLASAQAHAKSLIDQQQKYVQALMAQQRESDERTSLAMKELRETFKESLKQHSSATASILEVSKNSHGVLSRLETVLADLNGYLRAINSTRGSR